MTIRSMPLCILALLAVAAAAHAGECFNSAACSTPCPAEFSCSNNIECASGTCLPACEPSACSCDDGSWGCTDDCAGVCSGTSGGDIDGDGIPDNVDNCPLVPNAAQEDIDGDGVGDVCDPCPTDPTNTCNPCPDADMDGICDADDNCPNDFNPTQVDTDGDGIGDVCDPRPNDALNDADADGFCV